MTIEILVPELPESVADATIATWYKKTNDVVDRDEVIVDIETDKVILEVLAPKTGVLQEIIEPEGASVSSKQLIAKLQPSVILGKSITDITQKSESSSETHEALSPSVRRLLAEHDLKSNQIKGTGVGGRITRQGINAYLATISSGSDENEDIKRNPVLDRREKRVPMTRLRKTVANRLLEAKNNTAMLTTFNEVNMKSVIDLRKKYRKKFEERHGTRLGFMSFYVKAVIEALKRYPEINASIDGEDVIYHNYFDISIAVSTLRGLVTPVLKDCGVLTFAEIEKGIKELVTRGRDGKLTVQELMGGNFTITNGGVFGSLMSTPIINPPQSAILGMHKIQDRPMVVDGKIEILPMMYLALSYDHRLIDGRESVSFLVTIKELIEDPACLLLDI
ncbi:dihydrolipoyllysine-residue succinyltransferase component of 2-oxoglutarate dehydrogenase complex [Candidatus Photodesmus blepharus]|uniref:Dihydrolipoyllysine-residue succinyltransferase component of 2-oxoglutarate dehydrogenase complex n=1 Tax=Candidatus Photodesmus blepharonis TaxID=1179155 RepID=A0A084CN08_9GAMM|nr:2-oxoglutarate dehydrogenase complex dihydrolipoyllysine-residue succinyltransferase [Candidatus Photodesmus blepharus]KEY91187.1 dihydrolipoyllysine-residue succinyltransferase component of 2-oxoglutarate dehydrogenase complex [Candidatus Photodesmus blepharus]